MDQEEPNIERIFQCILGDFDVKDYILSITCFSISFDNIPRLFNGIYAHIPSITMEILGDDLVKLLQIKIREK